MPNLYNWDNIFLFGPKAIDMSFITLHLPVSKPIKKFLAAHFGEEYQPNQSDWLGILISSLLNRKSASNWETRVMKREHFEETYKINIRLSYADKHGIFLMPIHENLIRKAIENVFRESLYQQAILNKECYNIDYKTTFENQLEYYGIDEEDKSYYQTIIRDFNRKKEKLTNKLIS